MHAAAGAVPSGRSRLRGILTVPCPWLGVTVCNSIIVDGAGSRQPHRELHVARSARHLGLLSKSGVGVRGDMMQADAAERVQARHRPAHKTPRSTLSIARRWPALLCWTRSRRSRIIMSQPPTSGLRKGVTWLLPGQAPRRPSRTRQTPTLLLHVTVDSLISRARAQTR
jgi:hypothetical protein